MLKYFKRLILLIIIGTLVFILTHIPVQAEKSTWIDNWVFAVAHPTVDVFGSPDTSTKPQFKIYQNMRFEPTEILTRNGY